MDKISTFFTVFITIFLAEIGDKTQLATMLFATKPNYSKTLIFLGASMALTAAALVGVIAGSLLEALLPRRFISILAGVGFIVIGVIILIRGA